MPQAGASHPLATQQGFAVSMQVPAAPTDDFIPPPPVEAPPQLAPLPGSKIFTLQIEPHALVPNGKRLQVAAVDLTGLRVEIGRQLGLKDLKLQVRAHTPAHTIISAALPAVNGSICCLTVADRLWGVVFSSLTVILTNGARWRRSMT